MMWKEVVTRRLDKIGTVKAKGFFFHDDQLFLTDKSPLDGTGYYRLKMVDLDGKFKYSRTVPVTTDKIALHWLFTVIRSSIRFV